MNLTKVRSGTGRRLVTAALAAGALACGFATPAAAQTVTVAILPHGTEPEDLGTVDGLSPGLMSAGLSKVTSNQTYLDISAGNRLFTSLYDDDLPLVGATGSRTGIR